MKPPAEQMPPARSIVPYYAVAAFALVLLSLLCLLAGAAFTGHYFQPRILAMTHLAVFGWATMIIFGASNQLVPVICEQRLYRANLPVAIIFLLIAGTSLLVFSFWNFSLGLSAYSGGVLLLAGVILHAWNIYRTAKAGKENIVRDFLLAAHAWLIVTCILGFLLLVNLRNPFLSADHLHFLRVHASIGMCGWFLQLIIGVSSRLLPMFLLSRIEKHRLLDISYYTLNIGLVLFLLEGVVFKTSFGQVAYLLIIISGLVSYAMYVLSCYTSAMRKSLDNGMKQTFIALVLVSLPFILLLIILSMRDQVQPNVVTAYGFSFFFGFVSTIIMGQTFKTLPFIVWMHITQPNALPELLPKDLVNESWVKIQMLLYLPGFMLFMAGLLLKQTVLINTGAVTMFFAAVWYFIHVIAIIKKLKR